MYLVLNYRESSSRPKISSDKWIEHARTAFSVDPRIALSLASRFPTNAALKAEVTQLVQVCLFLIINIVNQKTQLVGSMGCSSPTLSSTKCQMGNLNGLVLSLQWLVLREGSPSYTCLIGKLIKWVRIYHHFKLLLVLILMAIKTKRTVVGKFVNMAIKLPQRNII